MPSSSRTTHALSVTCDLLEGAGDDEVGGVHGDQVGKELTGEVVWLLVVPPVKVGEQILALF